MMTNHIVDTLMVVAEEPQGPEFGKASPLGLLVILLLLVGTAFLIWSMNRQLKKLPPDFDTEHPEPDQAFDEGTDASNPLGLADGPAEATAAGSADAPPATERADSDERRPADT